MKLFTIVLDYMGATLISQVAENDPSAAIIKWASGAEDRYAKELGVRAQLLAAAFHEPDPSEIDGINHVWCDSGIVDDKLALLNIVETVSDSN